jgi:hypothetical protein
LILDRANHAHSAITVQQTVLSATFCHRISD